MRKLPKRYVLHKYQRLTKGFSDADMWDARSYLADLISATAWWHFSHNRGYPIRISEEEWLDALLEIYEGFKPNEDDELRVPDHVWDLLRENFYDLWD